MSSDQLEKCKTRGCYNPAVNGKYCDQCKKKRKETRKKFFAGAGGTGAMGLIITFNREAIKKAPEIASKALKVLFRG